MERARAIGNEMWNESDLHNLITRKLRGLKFIAVANREPYIHLRNGDQVSCIRPASGMANALDPIMRASGGTWVAHGGGSADRATVDDGCHVRVPPDNPSYTLRRVWLD